MRQSRAGGAAASACVGLVASVRGLLGVCDEHAALCNSVPRGVFFLIQLIYLMSKLYSYVLI